MGSNRKNKDLAENLAVTTVEESDDTAQEKTADTEKKTRSRKTAKAVEDTVQDTVEDAVEDKAVDTAAGSSAETVKEFLQVNAVSGLNCRASGSMDAQVVVSFVNGTIVTVLDKTDSDWYQISIEDYAGRSYTGYCNSKFLGPVKE